MKHSTAKGEEISAAGILSGVTVKKSRKGDLYANLALEDMNGRVEAMVFPEAYRRLGEKVKLEFRCWSSGGVRVEEGAAPKTGHQRDYSAGRGATQTGRVRCGCKSRWRAPREKRWTRCMNSSRSSRARPR